jgi:hypothetical protein
MPGRKGGRSIGEERIYATSAELAGLGAMGIKHKDKAPIPMMMIE